MCLASVMARVLDLPIVAEWSEMAHIFEYAMTQQRIHLWEFPLLACQAVGSEPEAAISGAAAAACLQLSLMLVDDMLDDDPRGMYHQLGQANAANLAFAFQAAAFCALAQASLEKECQAALQASFPRMALTVAFGQNLDAQNLFGEGAYWRIAETKSAPYFGSAIEIGALLGGASCGIAERLYELGFLIGVNVNIYDDLVDALQSPAMPDWKKGRNNLAILYALTADHPERAKFKALYTQVDDVSELEAAQQILVRSGAISYCVYHIVTRYQAAQKLLDDISVVNLDVLHRLLVKQVGPLVALLQSIDSPIPSELEVF